MRIVIIGAGAAGLIAAAEAALRGAEVTLLEKNSKAGVKILMSGGTRCNITQHTDARGILEGFGRNGRFLGPSVGGFPPADVVEMFRRLGVPTKVEPTGKVFPTSDRAVHVRDALQRQAVEAGAAIRLRSGVGAIGRDDDRWLVHAGHTTLVADRLIVTAGGRSWPGCGTTGDAYPWLAGLGHTLVRPRPALVPLLGGEAWMRELSGISLPDVVAEVRQVYPDAGQRGPRRTRSRQPLLRRRGAWLFTHFGFSGPTPMDISGTLTAAESMADREVRLDLLPERPAEEIGQILADRGRDGGRGPVTGTLARWFPQRFAEGLARSAGGECRLAELSADRRQKLIERIKRMPIEVTGTRGFEKAEVTAGGVALAEIDPRTMESRLHPGLYVAGEVLDLDGRIGGYNFQAAFSTGRAAGVAASTP